MYSSSRAFGSDYTPQQMLKSEKFRLLSYLTDTEVSRNLAKNGFFWLNNTHDDVQCTYCDLIIPYTTNNVELAHLQFSPQCSMAIGSASCFNIPKFVGFLLENLQDCLPTKYNQNRYTRLTANYMYEPGMFYTRIRKQSYINGPCHINSQNFADEGFYWLGISDYVRCFRCGLSLRNWAFNESPKKLHMLYSPNCRMVKYNGEESIIDYKFRGVGYNITTDHIMSCIIHTPFLKELQDIYTRKGYPKIIYDVVAEYLSTKGHIELNQELFYSRLAEAYVLEYSNRCKSSRSPCWTANNLYTPAEQACNGDYNSYTMDDSGDEEQPIRNRHIDEYFRQREEDSALY